jgi:hypothetical protein
MTCTLGEHTANRRAAALTLHALRDDAAGRDVVLAEASRCPHCATGVIDVLTWSLLGALRETGASDDEIKATMLFVTARAALAEATT